MLVIISKNECCNNEKYATVIYCFKNELGNECKNGIIRLSHSFQWLPLKQCMTVAPSGAIFVLGLVPRNIN